MPRKKSRICSVCNFARDRGDYSTKQWRKTCQTSSKCNNCTKKNPSYPAGIVEVRPPRDNGNGTRSMIPPVYARINGDGRTGELGRTMVARF